MNPKKIHGAQLNSGGSNGHNRAVNERISPTRATRLKARLIVGNFLAEYHSIDSKEESNHEKH